ncbi:MAG: asparaginase [Planctomycetia bacterium]
MSDPIDRPLDDLRVRPASVHRLAVVTRGGLVESAHFGALAVCDVHGRASTALGDVDAIYFLRSSGKPLQAVSCLRLGAADRFHWSTRQLAIVCSSHSSETIHRDLAAELLAAAGLTEDDLQCGPHPPMSSTVADSLARAGQSPTPLYNNCSGKHSGMLACCVASGWPTETYRDPDHPLQIENKRTIARFVGVEPTDVPHAVDGCGVPTFAASMRGVATAFARLAAAAGGVAASGLSPEDHQAAGRVGRAMIEWPYLVAGGGRLDTQLGYLLGDRLVVKGGAEGVFACGLPRLGLGVAFKIIDGSARAHGAIACRVLEPLVANIDWEGVAATVNRPIRNTLNETVGEIRADF